MGSGALETDTLPPHSSWAATLYKQNAVQNMHRDSTRVSSLHPLSVHTQHREVFLRQLHFRVTFAGGVVFISLLYASAVRLSARCVSHCCFRLRRGNARCAPAAATGGRHWCAELSPSGLL